MNEYLQKTAIYIPAYNAASTIESVLKRIPFPIISASAEVFVIDNCSTDNTSAITELYAKTHQLSNLHVLRNNENKGYGGSQKIAYRYAIEKGFTIIAMLHGDAQYAPELLEDLLIPVSENKADLLFGSRMKGDPLKGGMPIHRYLGNKFLTWVQNKLLGTKLSEFHSGYRVYSVSALSQVPFERLSSDYHFDTEIIILFKENNLRIAEVPIPTYYGSEKNYVNIWAYGMDVLITTGSYFLHKAGLRRSRNWSKIQGKI